MIELGKYQELVVCEKSEFGVYLKEMGDVDEKVLLPNKEVPEDTDISDHLEVFVYKDSEDRRIATVKHPKISKGQIKMLKVLQMTKIGAFLDWGLMKDLFLPFKEQMGKVKEGDQVLVGLYEDKSQRLCATMRISKTLQTESPFQEKETVSGIIYTINNEMGIFVAVEGKYHGLLPQKEVVKRYHIGEKIEAKVAKVNEDGKLVLTLKEDGFVQMEKDEQHLYGVLEMNGGFLPLTDKSDKEDIYKRLEMSKRAFKRSVGRLMKAGKLKQTSDGICLIESNQH